MEVSKKNQFMLIKLDSILTQYQYAVVAIKKMQELKEKDIKSNNSNYKNDAYQYLSHDSYQRKIQFFRI